MKLFSTLVGGAAALAFAVSAFAGETPFNQAQFEQSLRAGKPVVIDFAADWCPTCRAQKPLISAILQKREMASLIVFVANFDTEIALKKSLKVTSQSTLVVFKGGREVARSTGQTQAAQLETLMLKAL